MPPRGLEQIVGADDVAVEDRVPGTFDRKAAEMDDALHAGDGALHLGGRGEVGFDECFVGREVSRRLDVTEAKVWIDALEELAQPRADVAGCARDEDCLHHAVVTDVGCLIRVTAGAAAFVARVERSDTRGPMARVSPGFASLNPGYGSYALPDFAANAW